MIGSKGFNAAAEIDLVNVFAGKVAAANSAPRSVWDKTLGMDSAPDVGMP